MHEVKVPAMQVALEHITTEMFFHAYVYKQNKVGIITYVHLNTILAQLGATNITGIRACTCV